MYFFKFIFLLFSAGTAPKAILIRLYFAYIYRIPYEPLRFLSLLTNVMVHTIYTYGLYEFHWPYTNLLHY